MATMTLIPTFFVRQIRGCRGLRSCMHKKAFPFKVWYRFWRWLTVDRGEKGGFRNGFRLFCASDEGNRRFSMFYHGASERSKKISRLWKAESVKTKHYGKRSSEFWRELKCSKNMSVVETEVRRRAFVPTAHWNICWVPATFVSCENQRNLCLFQHT